MAITLKSAREIALMREAGEIVAEVLDLMRATVRPGITTGDLDRLAHELMAERGAIPSFLGYHGFPASVCTSVNEEIVHGIPGRRVLREGDIVSVDVGAILHGYHGDAALTLPVGQVSEEASRLIAATEEAFRAGLSQATVGNRLGDISAAIEAVADAHGCGLVREYTGHGIGREMHEDPTVPNYGRAGSGPRLRAGMTLAIEPMLTAGGHETRVLPDEWTVITADGSLAAHYEHTVLIREEGALLLTRAPDAVV